MQRLLDLESRYANRNFDIDAWLVSLKELIVEDLEHRGDWQQIFNSYFTHTSSKRYERWRLLHKTIFQDDASEPSEESEEADGLEQNGNSHRKCYQLIQRALLNTDPELIFIWNKHSKYMKMREAAGIIVSETSASNENAGESWRTLEMNPSPVQHYNHSILYYATENGNLSFVKDIIAFLNRVETSNRREDVYLQILEAPIYAALGKNRYLVVQEMLRASINLLSSSSCLWNPATGAVCELRMLETLRDSFQEKGQVPDGWDWSSLLLPAVDAPDDEEADEDRPAANGLTNGDSISSKDAKAIFVWEQAGQIANDEVMLSVVRSNRSRLWERFSPAYLQDATKDQKCDLLFDAIKSRNLDCVSQLLKADSDLVFHIRPLKLDDRNGIKHIDAYALGVFRICVPESSCVDIYDLIVENMVLGVHDPTKPGGNINEIERRIRACGGKQICLNLSRFRGDNFWKMVEEYRSFGGHALLGVEKTIKHLSMPHLEKKSDSTQGHLRIVQDHTEVSKLTDLLNSDYGLKKIFSLAVLDREFDPHHEDAIANICEKFEIEKLDWRRLDMSAKCLWYNRERTANVLSTLYLYTRGTVAVLNEWFGNEGLRNLTSLKELHIILVNDYMTEARVALLKDLIGQAANAHLPDGVFKGCKESSWHSSSSTTVIKRPLDDKPIGGTVLKSILRFVEGYTKKGQLSFPTRDGRRIRRIKVALLDSGVVAVDLDARAKKVNRANATALFGQQPNEADLVSPPIKDGFSFVHDEFTSQPWAYSEDEHGTQMAHLIRALDPRCELICARVGDEQYAISPENLASAINWACDNNADVICMSLAISSRHATHNALQRALDRASKSDIVMFAATPDKGRNEIKSALSEIKRDFPLQGGGPQIITACDNDGVRLRKSTPVDYDYLICGHEIEAGSVQFSNVDSVITGSSISTAIATGLASLVLSCNLYANGNAENRPHWRYSAAIGHLNKMVQTGERRSGNLRNEHYVPIDRFCLETEMGPTFMVNDELIDGLFGG